MIDRLIASVTLVLAAAIAISCGQKTDSGKQTDKQEQAAPETAVGQVDIVSLLPDADLQGFKVTAPPRKVELFQVREVIGDDAEVLMKYGLVGAAAGRYTADSGGTEFAASLFSFPDVRGAFGAYAQMRKPESNFQKIGSQGFFRNGSLIFFKNRFLVGLTPVDRRSDRQNAERLGVLLSGRLPGDADFPAAVSMFPAEGKVENSERYVLTGFLGYDFFSPTYTCMYHLGDSLATVFFSPRGATAEIIQYTDIIRNRGGKVVPDSGVGIRLYFVDDDTRGRVIMISRGGRIAGVVNTPDGPLGMGVLDKLWGAIMETEQPKQPSNR